MPEQMIVKCPFCKEGDIKINYTPKTTIMRKSSCSAKTAYSPFVKDSKTEVLSEKCPVCDKSKQEIQKALTHGIQPSKEDIIRRAKEAGLPLRF